MRFVSLCAGIEAATVAWEPLGWRPVWLSEIDPHACAVLDARHPGVPNLGDLTKLDGSEHRGSVDVVVGGTPCQSFSVAGLRAGLDDERGLLAFEFLRLVGEIRPRWVVWENVPGVLSLDEGRAFGTILGRLAERGYGFAYRVLDSQYMRVQSHPHAVPQRRNRVFIVGCPGDWRAPAAVLLERESLHGHPPPRRTAGQEVAGTVRARTSIGSGSEPSAEVVAQSVSPPIGHKVYGDNPAREGQLIAHDVSPAVTAKWQKGTGGPSGDECQNLVAFSGADNGRDVYLEHSPPVRAQHYGHAIQSGAIVRRLTPREVERLFGFPDDYTLVDFRGKPMADGPRYRLLGNSMAVNVMRWIGERIALADAL